MAKRKDLYDDSPTMWLCEDKAIKELLDLKFAFAALVSMCGTAGSYEKEIAQNAERGFRRRIDYLHDSLLRIISPRDY